MSDGAVLVTPPSWSAVVLVCKDCRKRSGGPAKLKPKDVASNVRRATKDAKHRPRVVLTTCLGICPKGAMTIGFACAADGTRVASVRTLAEVEPVIAALLSTSTR